MEILLTGGEIAIIDDCDADLVSGYKWRLWRNPRRPENFYVQASTRINGRSTSVKMHRLLMGESRNQEVDHADGDTLNNRRSSNLRFASSAQNSWNQGARQNNTSGHKGVYRHGSRWAARIRVDGKRIFLGCFDTAEEAAVAYGSASEKHHGAFART